jgi:hypothetical protein
LDTDNLAVLAAEGRISRRFRQLNGSKVRLALVAIAHTLATTTGPVVSHEQ